MGAGVAPDGAVEELAAWRRTFSAFDIANAEARILVRIYMELCDVGESRSAGGLA